jgi:hypothetical protein
VPAHGTRCCAISYAPGRQMPQTFQRRDLVIAGTSPSFQRQGGVGADARSQNPVKMAMPYSQRIRSV